MRNLMSEAHDFMREKEVTLNGRQLTALVEFTHQQIEILTGEAPLKLDLDVHEWDTYLEIAFKERMQDEMAGRRQPTGPENVAKWAAKYADAMLTERRKRRP